MNDLEQDHLDKVRENGHYLRWIINPSEAVIMAAIQSTGHAIQYVLNPSYAMQKQAVMRNGDALQYITKPTAELRELALRNYGYAIAHIDNPTDEEIEMAVRSRGCAIKFLIQPSKYIQRLAIEQNFNAIFYTRADDDILKWASWKPIRQSIAKQHYQSDVLAIARIWQYVDTFPNTQYRRMSDAPFPMLELLNDDDLMHYELWK